MRITHSPTQIPQRAFGPSTSSTPSTLSAKETLVRAGARDGFENTVSSRKATASTPSRAGDVQSKLREQFGALAADKQQFHETMRGIFGEGYDAAKAEQFRQQARSGNFDWLPPVKWVGADVLGGANGAYDSESGTVLLNSALQGDPSLAASTYVEEAGHHLDTQLNTVDSQGDEGELFRRVLGGEKLSRAQVAEIRAENDKGTIQLDGRSVEVEFWNPFKAAKKLVNNVVDTVKDVAQDVGNAVGNAAQWVGNAAHDAAQWVGNAAHDAAQWVGNTATGVVNTVKDVMAFFGLSSRPDLPFDGRFVGAGRETFDPSTPLSQIPAVTPSGNPNATQTVIYVNGISTNLEGQAVEMQNIANRTNMRVVGIHNSTEGAGVDLVQCANDKLNKGVNPAVDTLANTVYAELKAGRDVHLMGYSQGGLITARALRDVANRLRIEDGMSKEQTEQLMSHINVETFGSAGAYYPDGPKYVHYVNDKDIVPNAFGLGIPLPDPFDIITHPGEGAVVHNFSHGRNFQFSEAHDLENAYLARWVPFDQARTGQF